MKEAVSDFMDDKEQPFPRQPYDLTEEASRRPGGEKATDMARRLENDDNNEDLNSGAVNEPGGASAENRVTTSLSDD